MNFQHLSKLAEYNGKLPKLLLEISKNDSKKALLLLDEWANHKRPLKEIYNEAIDNIQKIS
ncbi:MAG TPA: hypothetical protein VEZ91_12060 [Kurthia gibsonii]|nr:hypothetical protein [Kurthia gibsonii]